MSGFISSMITGILSGMISGLYSGFIMYKYAVFSDAKRKVFDILNDFQYRNNGNFGEVLPSRIDRQQELTNISMTFSTHGYKKACTNVNEINKKLSRAESLSRNKSNDYDSFELINSDCYKICNELQPEKIILFFGKDFGYKIKLYIDRYAKKYR